GHHDVGTALDHDAAVVDAGLLTPASNRATAKDGVVGHTHDPPAPAAGDDDLLDVVASQGDAGPHSDLLPVCARFDDDDRVWRGVLHRRSDRAIVCVSRSRHANRVRALVANLLRHAHDLFDDRANDLISVLALCHGNQVPGTAA